MHKDHKYKVKKYVSDDMKLTTAWWKLAETYYPLCGKEKFAKCTKQTKYILSRFSIL
jgi:hypothetical protein